MKLRFFPVLYKLLKTKKFQYAMYVYVAALIVSKIIEEIGGTVVPSWLPHAIVLSFNAIIAGAILIATPALQLFLLDDKGFGTAEKIMAIFLKGVFIMLIGACAMKYFAPDAKLYPFVLSSAVIGWAYTVMMEGILSRFFVLDLA